ncbi:MAG: tryptophan--tRNA ligase [Mycobacteriaceae bacterium]
MLHHNPSQIAALQRSATVHEQVQAHPQRFRVLTGDRPTGPLHLGHYLGTLANRVRLQNLGVEMIVLIADYQVMTDRPAGGGRADGGLENTVRGVLADYLAAGIDPARATIFTHSAVPALNELVLPFLSLVSDAELHRNPTVRSEADATGRPPTGLMLTYPVHQAADILFCHANLVPVGLDQLPHLETTRLVARRFNERYGDGENVFDEPDALLTDTPMLAGLDGAKMSKTRGNGIALRATEDETAATIRRAPTDSERRITYDPLSRPTVATLLDILAAVTGGDPTGLAQEIGDGGAGRLKQRLTEAVNELLRPLRQRRLALAGDRSYLDDVLDQGNERARGLAEDTLATVHGRLGMGYANRRPTVVGVVAPLVPHSNTRSR